MMIVMMKMIMTTMMTMIILSRFILARMVIVWKLFSFLFEQGDSKRTNRAKANGNEIFS
jgi:5-bromo-4-chloroindolyl phosphate hydrolysis protein